MSQVVPQAMIPTRQRFDGSGKRLFNRGQIICQFFEEVIECVPTPRAPSIECFLFGNGFGPFPCLSKQGFVDVEGERIALRVSLG